MMSVMFLLRSTNSGYATRLTQIWDTTKLTIHNESLLPSLSSHVIVARKERQQFKTNTNAYATDSS